MLGLKQIAKLQQKKFRQETGLFVIEGTKVIWELLDSDLEIIQVVYTQEWMVMNTQLASRLNRLVLPQVVTQSQFRALVDTTSPQGVLVVVRVPQVRLESFYDANLIGVLEDIRDPGNLGTIIRTADWFGFGGLVLDGGVDPYQPKVVRSTMGSVVRIPIFQSQDLVTDLNQLSQHGFEIVVTRPESSQTVVIRDKTQPKQAVVFGNEARGTSSEVDRLADRSITIPKLGGGESLNVAVSFGIVASRLSC